MYLCSEKLKNNYLHILRIKNEEFSYKNTLILLKTKKIFKFKIFNT